MGVQTGMTGGSLGFFALCPRGSWVRVTGVPEGLNLDQLAAMRKSFNKDLGFPAEVSIQGSRASGNTGGRSDVDIAVRVSPETFDALLSKRWSSVNAGSSQARIRDHAVATGKITAGDVRPRLSGIKKNIAKMLGDEVDHVDVSVIRVGGAFDQGPFVRIK
ncbi:nucleotidyltransferase domain-containing protein [Streptomyces coelicoflavus]|uniref:Nucleotidyltransferase domain-containing protein n=2 Tax=Streptomyces coelicoflavus TaxID=285562 RepID=A0A7K3PMM2_9ACTN|nr:nucleotidyltransferase domain-containing protein [Streptomyces coelicoflavus]